MTDRDILEQLANLIDDAPWYVVPIASLAKMEIEELRAGLEKAKTELGEKVPELLREGSEAMEFLIAENKHMRERLRRTEDRLKTEEIRHKADEGAVEALVVGIRDACDAFRHAPLEDTWWIKGEEGPPTTVLEHLCGLINYDYDGGGASAVTETTDGRESEGRVRPRP